MISMTSLFITLFLVTSRPVHFLLELKNHITTPFHSWRVQHRFPSPRLPIFSCPVPWRAVQERKSWQPSPSSPRPDRSAYVIAPYKVCLRHTWPECRDRRFCITDSFSFSSTSSLSTIDPPALLLLPPPPLVQFTQNRSRARLPRARP